MCLIAPWAKSRTLPAARRLLQTRISPGREYGTAVVSNPAKLGESSLIRYAQKHAMHRRLANITPRTVTRSQTLTIQRPETKDSIVKQVDE